MADTPSELKTEIEKLEARHAANPEGRFFVPLANAYRKVGEVDRAESLLRDGLRKHPDYLSAHIVLGRCLADRGATREAGGEFQYVLAIDPQNLIALRTLGELAMDAGRTEEAARWYEQLLGVDPMNEEARRALESLPAAPAEEGEPSFPPGGEWWAEPPAPPPAHTSGPDDPSHAGDEVVTETIAALYARQGLHERAAGVYRELIRRRGGDPELERRLAEVEAASAGAGDDDSPLPMLVDPTLTPADDELVLLGDDPFAASFEQGFHGGEEDSPEPELSQPAAHVSVVEVPPAAGPTIAAYLAELAGWRPDAEPVLESEPESVSEPWESRPAPPVDERDPWEEPLPEPPESPDPWEENPLPDAATAASGTLPAEEPGFPWESPADPEPAPAAGPAVVQEKEEVAEEEVHGETAEDAGGEAADEEDDLESFQAWLRSLKR